MTFVKSSFSSSWEADRGCNSIHAFLKESPMNSTGIDYAKNWTHSWEPLCGGKVEVSLQQNREKTFKEKIKDFNDAIGEGEQNLPLISCKDITRIQDDWDVEEFVSKKCMGIFLHHPAFRWLVAGFIVVNSITIALQTDPVLEEKYFGLFSAIDTIVLAILFCELLLNWYYGFGLYWKDGWNIINFLIVFILATSMFVPALNKKTLVRVLRVVRLFQVCTLVSGLARMIQVILLSIPDMATIMILLFSIMLVFSVFGVTLFGSFIPDYFGNLGTALYSLFICITQDGWLNIYNDFEDEGITLQIGGALYFFVFIMCGAFICANLLVAVVTTNLEECITKFKEERQLQSQDTTQMAYTGFEEDKDEDYPMPNYPPTHVKLVMHETYMLRHQNLFGIANMGNLDASTCQDFAVVLEAIHENLKAYREIRDELDSIVSEVRSIRFNVEQEHEMVLRNIRGSTMSDTMLAADVHQGKPMDVVGTLATLEKKNMMDSEFQKGGLKTAAMRARRQSLAVVTEKIQKQKETRPKSDEQESEESEGAPEPEEKGRLSMSEQLTNLFHKRRRNMPKKKTSSQSQKSQSSTKGSRERTKTRLERLIQHEEGAKIP